MDDQAASPRATLGSAVPRLGLALLLLLLPLGLGCDELVDESADAMYDYVRSAGPSEVRDWGALRAGVDNMAPQLLDQLEVGTPPAPDEDEIEQLEADFLDQQFSTWPFPDGDSPMIVSPDPAHIGAGDPPAPGR